MNKHETMEVACKILSIYAFIVSLSSLQFPLSIRPAFTMLNYSMILLFVPTAGLLLLSVVLWLTANNWLLAGRIAAKSPQTPLPENASGITPQLIQSIVFSALGILMVVDSIAPLCGLFALSSAIRTINRNVNWTLSFVPLVQGVVKLGLGLWLLLGSKGLRKFSL